MEKLTAKLALALFSFFLVTALAAGQAETTHVFVQVKGLSCPFCVQGLEKRLKKLEAVESVSTSLKNGEAAVQLKPGRTVTEGELRQAVKKAGFTADQIRFETKPAPDRDEKPGPEGKI